MSYPIPILMVIFNRPDKTKKLFEKIKIIQPIKLYIAADGPRHKQEEELVYEARNVIKIDWECEVHYLYQDKNMGVDKNPINGINKMLEENEFGIILEDDIQPDLSFFRFVQDLLIRYRDNDKIGYISGMNPYKFNGYSYTFSRFGNINGWATWKRVWDKFNPEIMKKWNNINKIKWLKEKIDNPWLRLYYYEFFNRTANTDRFSWAYKFDFFLLNNNLLSIIPHKNLTTNIGFDEAATHKTGIIDKRILETNSIDFPLKHPNKIEINKKVESELTKGKRKVIILKTIRRPYRFLPLLRKLL